MKYVLFALIGTLFAADDRSVTMPGNLVVHEWGTFTSVAGVDGSAVDWDALGCQSDLPSFVNDYGYRGLKIRLRGTVRMETPVIYFYSPQEVDAHVKVTFPNGVITEWYPQGASRIDKRNADGTKSQLLSNLSGIDSSIRGLTGSLEWNNVKIQPGATLRFPLEKSANHYYAARATDAAPVTVGGQHEKFLFYRGVGRFPVPLNARIAESSRMVVQNSGGEPVPFVMLFENRDGRMGFQRVSALQREETLYSPALGASFTQLRQALEEALTAQGLFPKEAQAMVETWKDSWFEEGSRLIYIVPAGAVDAIVPLQVEPTPSKIVRVFVGRIELITPETQRAVESAVARNDWSAVSRYERFLNPIMQRVFPTNPARFTEAMQNFQNFRKSQGTTTCQ